MEAKIISSRILDRKVVVSLFILIALITGVKQYLKGSFNNYKIYTQVFWHSVKEMDLYEKYPSEYADSNHYGPAFAALVAPFAILPDAIGSSLWNIFNVLLLCLGFYSLPLPLKTRSLIALLCAHEALVALLSFQFNVGLAGMIMICFSSAIKRQEFRSAFAIALGTLIKLYGIVGLSFFFFIRSKWKFIAYGAISMFALILLPASFSSLEFQLESYMDWYHSLREKNAANTSLNSMQDISLMGIVRRILQRPELPNLPFLLSGLLLFSVPFLRISQYKHLSFQLMLLASVMIFTVIFSSGSESPTYIIAFCGVSIWFAIQPAPKRTWVIALFLFAFIITSMSPSDLFPKFLRDNFIRPYSLKALPCVLVWLTIVYQMIKEDFAPKEVSHVQ